MKKLFAFMLAVIMVFGILGQAAVYAYNMPPLLGTNRNQRQRPAEEGGVAILPQATDPMRIATGISNVNGDEIAFAEGRLFDDMYEKGDLPALGWNSWNAYQTAINANLIKSVADSFERLGLDKVGYEYIVIDDGCYLAAQGGNYDVLPSNHLTNFPLGFKDMSDYIHGKGTKYGGLKYGMYSNSAYRTCASQPAAYAMEDAFAEKLVEWGVDYIKYDFCSNPWNTATFNVGPALRTLTVADETDAIVSETDLGAEVRPDNVTWFGANGSNAGGAAPVLINGNKIARNAGGYLTGLGYQNGDNGYNLNRVPGEVWVDVTVEKAGAYTIGIEHSVQSGSGRAMQVDVNGERVIEVLVPTGTAWNWTNKEVELNAGINRIRIYNYKGMESSVESMAAFKDGMIKAVNAKAEADKIDPDSINIKFSLCEWGGTYPWNWAHLMGDSYRMVSDIKASSPFQTNYGWKKLQYDRCVVLDKFTGLDKAWADADMMVIGDPAGTSATTNRFTYEQDKQHFTEWCMILSPIMLGNRLPELDINAPAPTEPEPTNQLNHQRVIEVITNRDALGIHQDPLAIQAKRLKINNSATNAQFFSGSGRSDLLVKPLANGDVAVMFNATNSSSTTTYNISVTRDEIINGIGDKMVNKDEFAAATKFYLYDIWDKTTVEAVVDSGSDILASVTGLRGGAQKTYRVSLAPPTEIVNGIAFDWDSLYANKRIRALTTLVNNSAVDYDASVKIELFDSEGKLEMSATSVTKELSSLGLVHLKPGIMLPANVTGKAVKATVTLTGKDGVVFMQEVASIIEAPALSYSGLAPFANNGSTYVAKAIEIDIAPGQVYYYCINGGEAGSNSEVPWAPNFKLLDTSGGYKLAIPVVKGTPAKLEIFSYNNGVASDVVTHTFTLVENMFHGVFTPAGVLVNASKPEIAAADGSSLDTATYPVGSYEHKLFLWDDNYAPISEPLVLK